MIRKNIKKLYDKDGNFFAEFYYHAEYFKDYSKHSHDSFGLTFIHEGKIELDFHLKQSQYLLPQKIAVFNINEVHQTKAISKETLGYYGLHLDLEYCLSIQKKLFGKNKEFFVMKSNILNEKEIYEDLKTLLDSIINNEEKPYSKELESIVSSIFQKYSTFEENNNSKKEEKDFLKVIEDYILNNIQDQISLKDLALEVGYNESYISRVFKKKFGLSPHAFIVNKKVNILKDRLLKQDDVSISQLSSEMGFYDQSHLHKVFKRVYALSPKKYSNK